MPPSFDRVLDGLMKRYRAHVPDAEAVVKAMIREGIVAGEDALENDHIAFRTLGVPHLGIASLERIFLHYGFARRDRYEFPEKKVWAHWYHPPAPHLPRIFISELRVGQLSPGARAVVHRYTDRVVADPVDAVHLDDPAAVVDFLHRPLWPLPSWADYQQLLAESEFAAWVIYNRYYLNHFTIAVHNLPEGFDTIASFNAFLEARGFTLNDAGGTTKASRDGTLLQSSTVAARIGAPFDDGRGGREVHSIAGSYVEFIERRVLDRFADLPRDAVRREHRREGFEAANADRIFESTDTRQVGRRESPPGGRG